MQIPKSQKVLHESGSHDEECETMGSLVLRFLASPADQLLVFGIFRLFVTVLMFVICSHITMPLFTLGRRCPWERKPVL